MSPELRPATDPALEAIRWCAACDRARRIEIVTELTATEFSPAGSIRCAQCYGVIVHAANRDYEDDERATLLGDVHRIADGVDDIRALVVTLTARAAPPPRSPKELIIVDTLTSLERSASNRETTHPGYTWVSQSDLALVCRATRQLLRML
jgi:hypothetical protein